MSSLSHLEPRAALAADPAAHARIRASAAAHDAAARRRERRATARIVALAAVVLGRSCCIRSRGSRC